MANTFDTLCEANKAINKLLGPDGMFSNKGVFGGITKSVDNIMNKTDDGIIDRVLRAHTKDGKWGKDLAEGAKAQWNGKQIAGSIIGVGAAARIVTGGGIYKDKNGETDIIGIPFI